MEMDHAPQEFLTAGRRVIVAFLALLLLVAFWADRPNAAASMPKPVTKSTLLGDSDVQLAEPKDTFGISLVRKPWLTFYRVMGAPPLDRGALSEAEEKRFRLVVGTLAGGFFAAATTLLVIGRRCIVAARDLDA
jgi:hypothetical protein